MRCYYFGNMYLSSIQQGVQALHATTKLFVKYTSRAGEANRTLFDWAENHDTVILLNGGYSSTINELIHFFADDENPYPWASFHEGIDALDGALTCVGIVFPEKIYDTARMIREAHDDELLNEIQARGSFTFYDVDPIIRNFNKWEFEMLKTLNKFGLAK